MSIVDALTAGTQVWILVEGYPWWPAILVEASELGFENDPKKLYARFYGTNDAYVEERDVASAVMLPLEFISEKAQLLEDGLQEALQLARADTSVNRKRTRSGVDKEEIGATHTSLYDEPTSLDPSATITTEPITHIQDSMLLDQDEEDVYVDKEGGISSGDENDKELARLLTDDSDTEKDGEPSSLNKKHKKDKKHKKEKKHKSEKRHKKHKKERPSFVDDAALDSSGEESGSDDESYDKKTSKKQKLSKETALEDLSTQHDSRSARKPGVSDLSRKKGYLGASDVTTGGRRRMGDASSDEEATGSPYEYRTGRNMTTLSELIEMRDILETEPLNPSAIRKVLVQLTRVTISLDHLRSSRIGVAVANVIGRATTDPRMLPYQTLARALLLSWVSLLPDAAQKHLRAELFATSLHNPSHSAQAVVVEQNSTDPVAVGRVSGESLVSLSVPRVSSLPGCVDTITEASIHDHTPSHTVTKTWDEHVRDRLNNVVGFEKSREICAALHDDGRFTSTVAREYVVALEKNPELCQEIRTDVVTPLALIRMDRMELAPRSVKEELAHLRDENTLNLVALSKPSATLISTTMACEKCGVSRASFYSQQMRGADEPMTTFYNCLNCGSAWRVD